MSETNPIVDSASLFAVPDFDPVEEHNTVSKTAQEVIAKQENPSENTFNFKVSLKGIPKEASSEERETTLAKAFYPIVNPKKIPDGHCAKCAYNTHMHLIGRPLEEAEPVNDNTFVKFSKWCYQKYSPMIVEPHKSLTSNIGETFNDFRARVAEAVKEAINPGEGVLISVAEGAHWFNAYREEENVCFIDSQSGIGFNVYGKYNPDEENYIEIVKLSKQDIAEWDELKGT